MDLPHTILMQAAPVALLCAARVVGFVAIGTLPLGPGVPLLVRIALALVMSVAAVFWVLPGGQTPALAGPLVLAAVAELAVGGMLGLSVACVTAAAGWAGGVLGTISGLSWADDYNGGPPEAATPLARLVWWVAAAAFVSSGGGRMLMAGLLESFLALPLAAGLDAGLGSLVLASLAMACRLAVAVALPALVAVLAWHISMTIACRVIPLTPSTGLLQGTAAIVLLVALWLGGGAWTHGMADAMTATCEQVFAQRTPAFGEARR